jgi:hypothetical protein
MAEKKPKKKPRETESQRAARTRSKPAEGPGAPAPKPEAETAPAPVDAPEPPDSGVAPPYTVSSWKGLPNYECSRCAFATVDLDRMNNHWLSEHAPPAPLERIIDTGLVSPDGSKIARVVEAPAAETED